MTFITPLANLHKTATNHTMILTLPLKEMSRTEKLRAMEDIWHNLAADADEVPSPAWHEALLQETETAVANGDATFSDWETAKLRIRQRAAQLL
jgi:hypothetical protein